MQRLAVLTYIYVRAYLHPYAKITKRAMEHCMTLHRRQGTYSLDETQNESQSGIRSPGHASLFNFIDNTDRFNFKYMHTYLYQYEYI